MGTIGILHPGLERTNHDQTESGSGIRCSDTTTTGSCDRDLVTEVCTLPLLPEAGVHVGILKLKWEVAPTEFILYLTTVIYRNPEVVRCYFLVL